MPGVQINIFQNLTSWNLTPDPLPSPTIRFFLKSYGRRHLFREIRHTHRFSHPMTELHFSSYRWFVTFHLPEPQYAALAESLV